MAVNTIVKLQFLSFISMVVIQPLLEGVDRRCFYNVLRQGVAAVNNSLEKEKKLPGIKSAMLLA